MKSLVFLTAWCFITFSLVTCSPEPDSPFGNLLNPLKDLVGNLTGGKLTDFLSPTTKKIVFSDDAETTTSSSWSVSETTTEPAKPAKAISFVDETTTAPSSQPIPAPTSASSTSESQIQSTNPAGSMRTINSGPTFIFIG